MSNRNAIGYTSIINKKEWAGSFGSLMLQIPVMGGFCGGIFRQKVGNRVNYSALLEIAIALFI
ncbi:hypothetical protein OUZ56_028968 [Daphnia magna]|uniref:Uncharacterized protein n=1 Tax=Daphnia magna TaxID=35525 RepID=A0ABR0B5F0_9CRUS|nr:hypothetical protein OUZ56_028968 [Daphnia magna]